MLKILFLLRFFFLRSKLFIYLFIVFLYCNSFDILICLIFEIIKCIKILYLTFLSFFHGPSLQKPIQTSVISNYLTLQIFVLNVFIHFPYLRKKSYCLSLRKHQQMLHFRFSCCVKKDYHFCCLNLHIKANMEEII